MINMVILCYMCCTLRLRLPRVTWTTSDGIRQGSELSTQETVDVLILEIGAMLTDVTLHSKRLGFVTAYVLLYIDSLALLKCVHPMKLEWCFD